MRTNIKELTQQCLNCILMCRWRRCGQALMFSWPISSPFAIIHVDLWSPGYMTDHNDCIALMNTMCDMIQIVVVVPVPDETSTTLGGHSIQNVLMKFGICHLVVIDDGSPLREMFCYVPGFKPELRFPR